MCTCASISEVRRQNVIFAKNGKNNSTTMAKFSFAFTPRLVDCAEICLVGAFFSGYVKIHQK